MKNFVQSLFLSILLNSNLDCLAVSLEREHSDFMQGIVDGIHQLSNQPPKNESALPLSLALAQKPL